MYPDLIKVFMEQSNLKVYLISEKDGNICLAVSQNELGEKNYREIHSENEKRDDENVVKAKLLDYIEFEQKAVQPWSFFISGIGEVSADHISEIQDSCLILKGLKKLKVANHQLVFTSNRNIKEFKNFGTDCQDIISLFRFSYLSLLIVTEPDLKKRKEPSYSFSSTYIGWDFIVVPFICFLRGLSQVKKEYICGRIVHLSQSSGHGKTRLCIQLLKNQNRGIYCVYRNGDSKGFPKTTPWLNTLINFSRLPIIINVPCTFVLRLSNNPSNLSGLDL